MDPSFAKNIPVGKSVFCGIAYPKYGYNGLYQELKNEHHGIKFSDQFPDAFGDKKPREQRQVFEGAFWPGGPAWEMVSLPGPLEVKISMLLGILKRHGRPCSMR